MNGDFGERLARAREAAGLDRARLAAACQIFPGTYARLENGGRPNPSYSTILRLVDAGCGLEHFFTERSILEAAQRLAKGGQSCDEP